MLPPHSPFAPAPGACASHRLSCLRGAARRRRRAAGAGGGAGAAASPGGGRGGLCRAAASAGGGLRVSVGDPVSTAGEGAAGGGFAARSGCESGSLKAPGWFAAAEDERREEPGAGAVRGYRTQLLLERNIHSFRCQCHVEGGGVCLSVVSNSCGVQTG